MKNNLRYFLFVMYNFFPAEEAQQQEFKGLKLSCSDRPVFREDQGNICFVETKRVTLFWLAATRSFTVETFLRAIY